MIKSSGTGGTSLYVYDEAGHLVGEYDSSGNLVEETVWLGNTPVATLKPNGSAIAIYYVHTDHLNTPRQITRPADNAQLWTWFSDPFGTDAANANPAGTGTFSYNLRLPGQIFRGTAGLHQNTLRDYDPATGRYAESDPLGVRGGLNPYVYTGSSPLLRLDPFGLSWDDEVPHADQQVCQSMGYMFCILTSPDRASAIADAQGFYAAAGASILAPMAAADVLLVGGGVTVTEEGLAQVTTHLAQFGEYAPNEAMISRLASQLGSQITGADANFYTHELLESEFMSSGMEYEAAHAAALEQAGVSPFSLYHPEVIEQLPDYFNNNWRAFWGLIPP
jgi:RHS repeat-associated protein